MPTDLRPRQLRQAANKLRRGVDAEPEGFLVNDLADAIPEGGFEALFGKPRVSTALDMNCKNGRTTIARETDIIPEEGSRAIQKRALEIGIIAVGKEGEIDNNSVPLRELEIRHQVAPRPSWNQ